MITKLFTERKQYIFENVKLLINELTRKDILKGQDKDFIHHGKYTNKLKKKIGKPKVNGSNWYLDAIKGATLKFKITSAKSKGFYKNNPKSGKTKSGCPIVPGKDEYTNTVSFADEFKWLRDNFEFDAYNIEIYDNRAKLVKDLKGYFTRILSDGDVQISCDCPSFLYWGYKFQAQQMDYNTRRGKDVPPPVIRNPGLAGTVCKHLSTTLSNLATSPAREVIAEYLTDTFLSQQATRRYHPKKKQKEFWWMDFFKHIK